MRERLKAARAEEKRMREQLKAARAEEKTRFSAAPKVVSKRASAATEQINSFLADHELADVVKGSTEDYVTSVIELRTRAPREAEKKRERAAVARGLLLDFAEGALFNPKDDRDEGDDEDRDEGDDEDRDAEGALSNEATRSLGSSVAAWAAASPPFSAESARKAFKLAAGRGSRVSEGGANVVNEFVSLVEAGRWDDIKLQPILAWHVADCLTRWRDTGFDRDAARPAFFLNQPQGRLSDSKHRLHVLAVRKYLLSRSLGKSLDEALYLASNRTKLGSDMIQALVYRAEHRLLVFEASLHTPKELRKRILPS